jgi:hypothetical protein
VGARGTAPTLANRDHASATAFPPSHSSWWKLLGDLVVEADLFTGQSPARPVAGILFSGRLHCYGIDAHVGRNTVGFALAAELLLRYWPTLTDISIGTAERWSQWVRRDWAVYVGQCVADDREARQLETR